VTLTFTSLPMCSRPPSTDDHRPRREIADALPHFLAGLTMRTLNDSPGRKTGFSELAMSLRLDDRNVVQPGNFVEVV